MTLEQNIADLTTATTELTQQVLQTKSDADAAKDAAQHSAAAASTSEQSAASHAVSASAARDAAESARDAAQTAESNAVAVVTGGEGSLTPAPGKLPVADAEGKIDSGWIDNRHYGLQYKPSVAPTLSSDFCANEHKRYEQYGPEPKTILQQWSVARNSEATYFDANGVLQTAGINEPRIDYDPATGECRGLLREGQSTNLLTNSATFSGWLGPNHILSVSADLAPDGANAVKLTGTGTGFSYVYRGVTLSVGDNPVYSVFVKPLSRYLISLRNYTSGGEAVFNLDTLAITDSLLGGATLTPISGGWYRIACSFPITVDGVNNIAIGNFNENTEFLLWGAQLEHADNPSSYIKTEASAVTRVADIITPTV